MVDEFWSMFLIYFWGMIFWLMVDEFWSMFLIYFWGMIFWLMVDEFWSMFLIYSGFQNCPNVCVFSKDLNIVAQLMNIFLEVLLYLKLYHFDFSFQFKLCNLDQNLSLNELNKKSYHWGSFGTLQFYTIVWTISSNIK